MKTLFKYYILIFLVMSDLALFAQPGEEAEGGGLSGNDAPAAPINGKLVFLAIIGILFVLYTYRKNKQQRV